MDIFGSFRSPVLATSDGRVTRVNENKLGGKVIWFKPKGKDYTLYYAHLDEQIAIEGQEFLAGETLGLMGNTGNAKSTPTHLHFGIYSSSGAIDPFPFINPNLKVPANISAPLSNLNKTLRTKSDQILKGTSAQNSNRDLPKGTIVKISAASVNGYRVILPNGAVGFLNSSNLISVF
ncbi:MAG: M23 family metallopeptidase [Cytophagaceae bacterium]|nr:MAG: M23 family metallopeptidase [Cytophagaceae bacterium]